MTKQISKWMIIGIALLQLGGAQSAVAQIPWCPPFCQVKAESKGKPKVQKPAKANAPKKQKQAKKGAAA